VECICGDGTAIPPLIIFKGETLQKAWIPPEADKEWAWTNNSKGWTCDNIGIEWVQRVFDPATRAKANGDMRALICDGHGSHATSEFIGFCIANKIEILLMPPHSSHICQPLDVGVFSPVKTYMSSQLTKFTRYKIDKIQKFEWAEAYRIARPKAMTEENIKSAFRKAGLIPLNRRKGLCRLPGFDGTDCDDDETTDPVSAPDVDVFAQVPSTPSRMDPATVLRAGRAMLTNVAAGIIDTPTKDYLPKLFAFAEYTSTRFDIATYESEEKDKIIKKRREVTTGK
jgi:hypothetical protein